MPKTTKLQQGGDPFTVLVHLENLYRKLTVERPESANNRASWLGYRVGTHRFLITREVIREVLSCPHLTRVPGASPWLRGIANVRGMLLPVTDLSLLSGGEAIPLEQRRVRVIGIKHPTLPVGLLVDEVFGFKAINENLVTKANAPLPSPLGEHVVAMHQAGDQCWWIFDLYGFIESEEFQSAANH